MTNIYRCAWPDGSFSVVAADDEEDAIFILDELGSATADMLTQLHGLLIDFTFDHDKLAELLKRYDEETANGVEDWRRVSFHSALRVHFSGPDAESLEVDHVIATDAAEAKKRRDSGASES